MLSHGKAPAAACRRTFSNIKTRLPIRDSYKKTGTWPVVPLLFILPSQERPLQVPVSTLRCNRRTCCILTALPWGHPASRRLSALLGSHVPQSPCPSPSSLHETMSGRLLCKTIPRVLSSSTLSFKNSTHYKICQKRLSVLFCLFSRIYLENITFSSLNILVRIKVRMPA